MIFCKHYKGLLARSKMSQDELDNYYEMRRKVRYEAGKGPGNLWWKRLLHPVLLLGIKVERVLRKDRLVVIGDKRSKSDRPKIYASTHVGGHDVENCFEAIKKHAFLFIGDPREAYRNFDGLMLFLNGMICLETRSKTDRKIAKENALCLLKKIGGCIDLSGGSLEYFRESFGKSHLYGNCVYGNKEWCGYYSYSN